MPGTTITGSPNISLLDSKIVADVCAGNFVIDATPSIFIGSGASNVLGVKVKIVNPYGVTIKDYTTSYDIAPPITGSYTRAIPTQAGKVQYGTYTIYVQLTDADDETYEVVKSVNVCTYNEDTYPCDDRILMSSDCRNGRLTVRLAEPPVFKGFYAESRTQALVLYYPTASGVTPLTTSFGSFAVQLFEGEYKLTANVCATYNLTDNVYLKLGYTGTFYKKVRCLLDYTCIWPRIKQLWDKINEDCSQIDRDNNASIALQASLLIHTITLANDAGEDASVYIEQLETLLGCTCTCDCNGLPILNGSPSSNLLIEGCNVASEVVGLTTVYTIDAYQYIVTVDPTQDILTASAPSLTSCTFMQQVRFSIANAYAGIKTLVTGTIEYDFWAAVINNTLNGLDPTCYGYTSIQWAALTFAQKFNAVMQKACTGGTCNAIIENVEIEEAGNFRPDEPTPFGSSNVLISWDNVSGVFGVDIYIDDVLVGSVLSGVTEFLAYGYADGETHEYVLIPKCANGSGGTTLVGTFLKIGCPSISPPVVSQNTVDDAECPYDLTALVSTPPVGIETEWHTANNTNPGSLVADPTAVSSGVYYAFSKNSDGCYSSATTVTVICEAATSCTAPQTLTVSRLGGCDHLVLFQSAAFPPPGDSYTVKRRLYADPDVDGSYTTLGTPTWNPSLNRWTLCDSAAVDNVLYVYKAISNCGGSPGTTPFTTYTYANINCPALTLTPDFEFIDYEFTDIGGSADKYEISIYDETGTVLLHTDTFTPAFPSPITGTFLYLTQDTTYRIQVKVFMGTYTKVCDATTIDTLAP